MNAILNIPDDAAVPAKHPPKGIRTEAENDYYTAILYELDQRSESLSPAERELADLLTLLIEDFEAKHNELPKASPVEVVRFLMDQHNLKQKDMLEVFGTASIASEVLNGKRELSKEHIRRLADRFSISTDLLI
jgi:HTH-type transcriptional regulator/antitoxin HigA